ncbi:MAG TPA: DinB family protein [Thermoanaerobaculia bacterium]|nr:DinB family protein [Thermoanaerobaculia bacterium]
MTTDTPFSNRPGADQGAYITGLLELLGDRDPLAVLAATPGEVRRSLEGVPEDELRRPEAPGKWSRLQVAAHLADSEVAIAWRLRLTIAQDRPPLTGYDQDAWADRLGYAEADLDEVLEVFEVLRAANVRLLRRLAPADWERVAVHAERGEESVRHMAKLFAGHDLLHLRQIERIRRAFAAPG